MTLKPLPLLKSSATLLATAGCLLLALYVVGYLFRPQVSQRVELPPREKIDAAQRALEVQFDPDDPIRFHVPVDYAEGEAGAWYPKGESPVLAELVAEGRLPPVAQRVGPEPCVYRGVEGIGEYGGTWRWPADRIDDLGGRFSGATLVRWSPGGHPLVPHIAKSWEVSEDYRSYTFHLRKGMRWSDGHPFTADDILYWWEHEATDPLIESVIPAQMIINGKPGKVEKIDDHTVRFSFPDPHGLFLPLLARSDGAKMCGAPRHYLKPYHPREGVGDAALIRKELTARKLPSAKDLYTQIKAVSNPEHPRTWPWVYHTYTSNAPFSIVRNPYYFVVDTAGNQLPYVDHMQWEAVQREMAASSIATGRFTFTISKPRDLTLLIDGQQGGDYRVYRWMRADRSDAMVHVNLNRKAEEGNPTTASKRELLRDKRFRQALSLAINRQAIIDSQYHGETKPALRAPGPESPFYNPRLYHAFTDYDPKRANALLDDIGLTHRDAEGYRTDKDGRRLTFFLNHPDWLNPATALFIADDWSAVGVRTIPRMRNGRMFYTEKAALVHDFTMWTGENELYPLLTPRVMLPVSHEANFALAYAKWYLRGGLYGDPKAAGPGVEPLPADHPLREALSVYEQIRGTGDTDKQVELFKRITDIAAENTWTIGYVVAVKNNFRNVPDLGAYTFTFLAPSNCGLETYYFAGDTPNAAPAASIQHEIMNITAEPHAASTQEQAEADARGLTGRVVKWLVIGIGVCALGLVALRHPFVARRLLIMVPTLLFISVVVFLIIDLPPGDYIEARIAELQTKGDAIDQQELVNIKAMYHLDKPLAERYLRWMGVYYFLPYVGGEKAQAIERWEKGKALAESAGASYDVPRPGLGFFRDTNTGLLQGNLGRSMTNDNKPVNQVVGDRITLTFLISLGTILFTWALAIPIGIYSAVRQYSIGDYAATLIGFVGMCVPSFLLALLLMFFSQEALGIHIDRLFSDEYALRTGWSVGKFIDLLKHIWAPVLILGVGGTAGMIRIMRGNLLDELKKPYVTTARAKGVRPLRLLLKYPVRLALNPFISGIGSIFPQLISGGTLVAVVLSLPTVGPLMLEALLNEDTYLAGSMLMVLSLLGIFGVLVSDLLLLWLDPRIRFEGGAR